MIPELDQINQLIVLMNIYEGRKKPSEISREIGITLQGVIYHMKNLKGKGFIDNNNSITKEGFQFLYSGLSSIREFVSSSLKSLDSVMSWEAIAEEDVEAGEKVFLRMNDGYLYASKSGSGATGKITVPAMKNSVTSVSELEGIINLRIGSLEIAVLPSADRLNSETLESVRDLVKMRSGYIISIMGEESLHVANILKLLPRIEFSPVSASFEACIRGLDTLLITSAERFHYSLEEISSMEAKYGQVKVHITDFS